MNLEEAVRYAVKRQSRCEDAQEKAFLLRAEEALREQVAGEWIRVTERLPRDSRPVLVSSDRGAIFRAYYDHVHGCWRTTKTINITHWRRMPLPPEREE